MFPSQGQVAREEGQTSRMDTRMLSPGEEGRVGTVVLLGQWDLPRPLARTFDKVWTEHALRDASWVQG